MGLHFIYGFGESPLSIFRKERSMRRCSPALKKTSGLYASNLLGDFKLGCPEIQKKCLLEFAFSIRVKPSQC